MTQSRDDFETFWKAYPKKRSKGDAMKAWGQMAGERPEIGEVLRTLEMMKKCPDWIKDGGKFIPYPGTWIRALGWFDEPDVAVDADPMAGYDPEMDIGGWEYRRRMKLLQGGEQ